MSVWSIGKEPKSRFSFFIFIFEDQCVTFTNWNKNTGFRICFRFELICQRFSISHHNVQSSFWSNKLKIQFVTRICFELPLWAQVQEGFPTSSFSRKLYLLQTTSCCFFISKVPWSPNVIFLQVLWRGCLYNALEDLLRQRGLTWSRA